MTKVNRHRTYGMTPERRIIAKTLIEPGMGTGRPLLNRDLRKPVKLTRNAGSVDVLQPRRFSEMLRRVAGLTVTVSYR